MVSSDIDEPTNHVSIDGVLWLQRTLATHSDWKSRIVCVVRQVFFFLSLIFFLATNSDFRQVLFSGLILYTLVALYYIHFVT